MSELAFNANGDNFEVPAIVTGWRVRRLKPRGAPELVYGRDGRPLTIGIDSDMHELRDAVGGVLGRYRLDPINDDGKTIDSVPAAYVQVVKPERQADPLPHAPVAHSESEGVLREAMRLNTELAKAVVDRFPEMMTAAADLLRAADGAGLPARTRAISDEHDDEPETPAAGFDLSTLFGQLMPLVIAALGKSKVTMPDLAGVLDWRKAAPGLPASEPRPATRATDAATPAPKSLELPPIKPETMAHFIAIQSALEAEEAALARGVAGELGPAELRAWFDELSKLSVPDAVAKIRSLIGKGGAS